MPPTREDADVGRKKAEISTRRSEAGSPHPDPDYSRQHTSLKRKRRTAKDFPSLALQAWRHTLCAGENGPRPATKKEKNEKLDPKRYAVDRGGLKQPQFSAAFHAYYHLYDVAIPERFLSIPKPILSSSKNGSCSGCRTSPAALK